MKFSFLHQILTRVVHTRQTFSHPDDEQGKTGTQSPGKLFKNL